MIFTIDEQVCKKYDIKVEEVLALLLVKSGVKINELYSNLEQKQALINDIFNNYMITQRYDDIVSSVLLDSDKSRETPERIENLALELMKVFPKEKKAGTCHYFKGNKKDISLKLKKFFKLYGNQYTDEQMINAAKRYVDSFNGNYTYMRILKYFIWKDERKTNEDGKTYVEETSDLATWIENEGQSEHSSEWGELI